MPFPAELTEEDRAYKEEIRRWQTEETGYSLIQGTRPQTPAYALTDYHRTRGLDRREATRGPTTMATSSGRSTSTRC